MAVKVLDLPHWYETQRRDPFSLNLLFHWTVSNPLAIRSCSFTYKPPVTISFTGCLNLNAGVHFDKERKCHLRTKNSKRTRHRGNYLDYSTTTGFKNKLGVMFHQALVLALLPILLGERTLRWTISVIQSEKSALPCRSANICTFYVARVLLEFFHIYKPLLVTKGKDPASGLSVMTNGF